MNEINRFSWLKKIVAMIPSDRLWDKQLIKLLLILESTISAK